MINKILSIIPQDVLQDDISNSIKYFMIGILIGIGIHLIYKGIKKRNKDI